MKTALVDRSSSTLEVPEDNITLRRKSKPLDPRLANSVPADIEEYTSWMELTRLPRQKIGWDTLEMLPYEHPDEDYDADANNVIPLGCGNIAKLGLEIKELGDHGELAVNHHDSVLALGAIGALCWQVRYFRLRVAPQLKALRDYHPELATPSAVEQTNQPARQPADDATISELGSQLMNGAKTLHSAWCGRDRSEFRRAFCVVEAQCELLPALLTECVEAYYENGLHRYAFGSAFASVMSQLHEPLAADAELPAPWA